MPTVPALPQGYAALFKYLFGFHIVQKFPITFLKEVLLTLGSYGSLIYAGGNFYEIPAYPPAEVVDATGCGDTYMTGYLYKRNQGADYLEAGKFAAAMCTLKLGASGPFSADEAAVNAIVG